MVLVHMVYEKVQFAQWLYPIILDYTRFAAGGFVFFAGLAVGKIYLPKARLPERRWEIYGRLIGRSVQLFGWQVLIGVSWIGLGIWRGNRPAMAAGEFLRDLFSLREGGDLLPLYMVLLVAAPLMLELCRRRGGRIALAVISVGLFVTGRFSPYLVCVDPTGCFPPLLWQAAFVGGLLAGSELHGYDALARMTKIKITAAVWAAFALLFWSDFWQQLGLPACPVSLVFTKVPLTTGELLRYLTLIMGILLTTDLFWQQIQKSRLAAFAQTLGRSTLQVYVAQVFLMDYTGMAATWWLWWIGLWQMAFVPLCLGLLWLIALGVQWTRRRTSPAWAIDWSFLFGPAPGVRQAGE
jgi:hypothetical protein